MKKYLLIAILLLAADMTQAKVKLHFGSRAGVNSSFSSSSPGGYSVSSQVGFNAGVYAQITSIWKKLYNST